MKLVNSYDRPLTSIGGKIVWGFQGDGRGNFEEVFSELYEDSFLDNSNYKKFLDIELNSNLLAIFNIEDGKKHDTFYNFFKEYEFNFYLIKDEGYYSYREYIFHNKKVKVIYLMTKQMEFFLVNKKHLPSKYEIRNQWWIPGKEIRWNGE